jgi:hypothetical protein
MLRVSACALVCGMAVLTAGLRGQDAKKDEPKVEAKARGYLPQNWAKIGLTDDQKQSVYKIQNKYGEEIDKLDAKIKQLKDTRDKEMRDVLTADQKKKLEEIFRAKAGTGK